MASTGVAADEAPMDRYPVDDIRERTTCELHVGVRNLCLKATDGYALSCESSARWHCNPIPDGYGRVGVDHILPGYDSLELDIPGAEDERTLGEVGVVSFYGARYTSCFQARRLGHHRLLRDAIYHLQLNMMTRGTTRTNTRVHIGLLSRLRRISRLLMSR